MRRYAGRHSAGLVERRPAVLGIGRHRDRAGPIVEGRAGNADRYIIGLVQNVVARILHDVVEGCGGLIACPDEIERRAARIEAGAGGRADIANRTVWPRDRVKRGVEVGRIDIVVGDDVGFPLAMRISGVPVKFVVEDSAFQTKGRGEVRDPLVGRLHLNQVLRQ